MQHPPLLLTPLVKQEKGLYEINHLLNWLSHTDRIRNIQPLIEVKSILRNCGKSGFVRNNYFLMRDFIFSGYIYFSETFDSLRQKR